MLGQEDSLSAKDHQRVAKFVEESVGIQLPEKKRYLLEGRLRKRQRALGMKTLNEYINYVLGSKQGQSERDAMIDALTTNKTDFFREPEHFKFISEKLVPTLCARQTDRRQQLKIWSAGCSTGAEAYTLAMVLSDLSEKYPGLDYDILATDISQTVMDQARRGIYGPDDIEPIPLNYRRKYLLRHPQSGAIKIDKALRSKVRVRKFNLLGDNFSGPSFDFIFCRNVMIYFSPEDREALIRRFTTKIKPGGFLFVGHSERLTFEIDNLRAVIPTVYQKVG